jgi:hypothetical protein
MARPEDWAGSSFLHYLNGELGELGATGGNRIAVDSTKLGESWDLSDGESPSPRKKTPAQAELGRATLESKIDKERVGHPPSPLSIAMKGFNS